jgi:hypothetical protein
MFRLFGLFKNVVLTKNQAGAILRGVGYDSLSAISNM